MEAARKPSLLVLEFWGLGDLSLCTTLLARAREDYEITLAAKPYARPLLEASFPEVRFLEMDVPWSVFRGKYRLWKWPWRRLFAFLAELRRGHFDAAISVRNDPRDHLLLWLSGARRRIGFPVKGSQVFLTTALRRESGRVHKVDDWRAIGEALGLRGMGAADPLLTAREYDTQRISAALENVTKRVVCLHPGARIPVRRWPEASFADVIARMRREFDFHLVLIPEVDGYGRSLAPLADCVLEKLSLPELVDLLGRSDVLLCNDSGPGHIAAACGTPTVVMFGPADPDAVRPWGAQHHVVIRDICALRPCSDYCPFPEPYCLTKLTPDETWPEIRAHLQPLLASASMGAAK